MPLVYREEEVFWYLLGREVPALLSKVWTIY